MSDGDMAPKLIEDALVEGLSHKSHSSMDPDSFAIKGGNASALLSSMLKGIEGKIGEPSHILARSIDAEDATALM